MAQPSSVSLSDLPPADPAAVGGKAANLARLTAWALPVPAWFAVDAGVYRRAIAAAHAAPAIDGALRELGGPAGPAPDAAGPAAAEDPARLSAASSALGALVRGLALAPEDEDRIRRAVASHFPDPASRLAVRSSALGEDGTGHSFAGQHDTVLGVQGADAVLDAIRTCWASAWSERAIAYRRRAGLPLSADGVAMAVVVQRMVPGEASGVLFTANPTTGARHEAVVSATWGLGEGLVSGLVDADHWVVDSRTGAIDATLATKAERVVPGEGGLGTRTEAVPAAQRDEPCLSEVQLRELVALGERLVGELGTPQDVEFTYAEGALWVLQARPITSLPAPAADGPERVWDNSNIAESYYGVTTPLTFSFVSRMYEVVYQVLLDAFGIPHTVLRDHQAVFGTLLGLLRGRIYYNLTSYHRFATFLPAWPYLEDLWQNMVGVQVKSSFDAPRLSAWERWVVGPPRILALAARIGWHLLIWDREVEGFMARFDAVRADFKGRRYDGVGADELLSAYRELESRLLWHWRAPMTNDFWVMLFHGALKALVVRWGLDPTGGLANDLLAGEGGLASAAPAKGLEALADLARPDEALVALLRDTPDADLPAALEAPEHAAFKAAFDAYLAEFGDRCMGELKLEVPRLHEDPAFAFAVLRNLFNAPPAPEATADGASLRAAAEAKVARVLRGHPLRRWLFDRVLRDARKAVRCREELRLARTKAFGLVRAIVVAYGRVLAGAGVLARPDDVFYLEFDELFAYAEGRTTCTRLFDLAQLRRAEFEGYAAEDPPDRLVTRGAVHLGDQLKGAAEAAPDGPVLTGTPCCPGKAAAPARVVLGRDADLRLSGEILVTERTDPGWVPLYPSVSGLLIERGSLLSHAAVVAREMGLPTVIGVKGLIARVRDGQWLELDGQAGTVKLDAPPPGGQS